jgi:hypothetical protein
MSITDKLKDIAGGVGDKLGDVVETIKKEAAEGGKIDAALDAIKDKAGDIKDAAAEKIAAAKDSDALKGLGDKVGGIKDVVVDKVGDIKDKLDGQDGPTHTATHIDKEEPEKVSEQG